MIEHHHITARRGSRGSRSRSSCGSRGLYDDAPLVAPATLLSILELSAHPRAERFISLTSTARASTVLIGEALSSDELCSSAFADVLAAGEAEVDAPGVEFGEADADTDAEP